MKKIFTLLFFVAAFSMNSMAQNAAFAETSLYEAYNYFPQSWSQTDNVVTLHNFINSGCDLVCTINADNTVSLSAPETQSYENGGYFYFCDATGNYAGLLPPSASAYYVFCGYSAYCTYVAESDYGPYISLGAYWDTAYQLWSYLYVYLMDDYQQDATAIQTIRKDNNNVVYNLNGTHMSKASQGLNIVNGKKIMIK